MRKKAFVLAILLLLSVIPLPARAATTGTLDYLTYSIENDEVTITDCDTSASGELIVPDTIDGYPVTKIEIKAFLGCSELTRITLPDAVREIGDNAFCQCRALVAVDLPASLEMIGSSAFQECSSLSEFVIPKNFSDFYAGITGSCPIVAFEVEEGSPYYCTDEYGVVYNSDMTMLIAYPGGREGSYSIPPGVTTVASGAFHSTKITSVTFPESLTTLRNGSFGHCYYLSEVFFTDNITYIGESCFTSTILTEVVIPSGITELPYCSFHSNTKLERVVLHAGITTIGQSAFADSYALSDVTFLHSAEDTLTIDSTAFQSRPGHPSSITGSDVVIYIPDAGNLHPAIAGYDWNLTMRTATFASLEATQPSVTPATSNTAGAAVTPPAGGWVEGTNTFTVSCEIPCVVAVSQDGGATYSRLTATAAETSYSFTAENVTAETLIGIAVAGDANGDGKVTNADITRLRAAYAGKIVLNGLQNLAVDVNGDGKITNADVTRLRAAYAGKVQLTW